MDDVLLVRFNVLELLNIVFIVGSCYAGLIAIPLIMPPGKKTRKGNTKQHGG